MSYCEMTQALVCYKYVYNCVIFVVLGQPAVQFFFGVRTPVHSQTLRTPQRFCLNGYIYWYLLYIEIKIEKFKK